MEEQTVVQKALESGIVSQSQIQECFQLQKKMEAMGVDKSLQEIFAAKGYIALEVWEQLYEDRYETVCLDEGEEPVIVEESLSELDSSAESQAVIDATTIRYTNEQKLEEEEKSEAISQLELELGGDPESEPALSIYEENFPHIPGYKIVDTLGKGAVGKVYRGTQLSMERQVAIKVLEKSLCDNFQVVERFTREAQTIARLNHDNIIGGIDAGTTPDGTRYFVMEFVEGETLGEILDREKKLELERAVDIIIQIADALEYARSEGIVHRDIKPDNIMISDEEIPKLCDLGLAREKSNASRLTVEGTTLGTPYYMSPEQARGLPNIDHRSDIYSLGATFFHMVTGSVPFPNNNPAVVCAMHATKPFPDPRQFVPEISQGLCDIIRRCTEKDPNDRYQTCAELIEDLEDVDLQGKATEAALDFADEPARSNIPTRSEIRKTVTKKRRKSSISKPSPVTRKHSPVPSMAKSNVAMRKSVVYVAEPEPTSNSSLWIGLVLLFLVVVGAGIYVWHNSRIPISSPGDNINTVLYTKEEKDSAQKELDELQNRAKLCTAEETPQILDEYDTLQKKHKNADWRKKIVEAETAFRDKWSKKATELREALAYAEKIVIVESSPQQWREAWKALDNFPQALSWTQDGKFLKDKKEEIYEYIRAKYEEDKIAGRELIKEGSYRKALARYKQMEEYILKNQQDERAELYQQTLAKYQRAREIAESKYADEFWRQLFAPTLVGKYDAAREICNKYNSYRYFRETVENTGQKLTILEKAERLGKIVDEKSTGEIIAENSSETTRNDWYWALGIVYMKKRLWEKAEESFVSYQGDGSELYKKRIVDELEKKAALTILEQAKSQYRKKKYKEAWRGICQLVPGTASYVKEKASEIEKFRDAIGDAYIRRYAVSLYFQKDFDKINLKTLDFEISYDFHSPAQLDDFLGTEKKCRIRENRLEVDVDKDVFELCWKGKIDGSAAVETTFIVYEDTKNIGISLHRQKTELSQLDQYLALYRFDMSHFILCEVQAKSPERMKETRQKLATMKNKSAGVAICLPKGRANFLVHKTRETLLRGAQFPTKDVPKASLMLSTYGRSLQCEVEDDLRQVHRLSGKNPRMLGGYVGLYANSRTVFEKITIKGRLDRKWVKGMIRYIQRNKTKYLEKVKHR